MADLEAVQEKNDESFAYIVQLIKTRLPAAPATTATAKPATPTHHGDGGSRAIIDGNHVLVGGSENYKILVGIYQGLLLRAKRDRDPPRKLALLLTTNLFSNEELATANATGKSLEGGARRVAYPQLHLDKLSVVCQQVKLEFPGSNVRAGDGSCEIMQAINGICRKRRVNNNY